jgi:hypothetical protein
VGWDKIPASKSLPINININNRILDTSNQYGCDVEYRDETAVVIVLAD